MAHATDIVGYTYRADQYCPSCIVGQITVNPGDAHHRERPPFPEHAASNAETHLDVLARFYGVQDRYDEKTFDSDNFPKVIFQDQVSSEDNEALGIYADRCGACHELLADVWTL